MLLGGPHISLIGPICCSRALVFPLCVGGNKGQSHSALLAYLLAHHVHITIQGEYESTVHPLPPLQVAEEGEHYTAANLLHSGASYLHPDLYKDSGNGRINKEKSHHYGTSREVFSTAVSGYSHTCFFQVCGNCA